MDWDIYQVSYKTPSGVKQTGTITALSVADARKTLADKVRIDNNQWFDCIILRVWRRKPASPKQILSRRYGFILGGIKGAHTVFRQCRNEADFFRNAETTGKVGKAVALVDSQFAKLERDIRDVFKLAGLKVK